MAETWAIALVVLATMVGSFGPMLLKKASSQLKLSLKAILTNGNLIGGYLLYALATMFFIPALRGGDLSTLYPVTSLSYVWVSLLSVRFLGEKMNLLKWAGIASIMLGITLIGFGS